MYYKQSSKNRTHYSLGDLILAVGSYSKNSQELTAVVIDLIESGRVRLLGNRCAGSDFQTRTQPVREWQASDGDSVDRLSAAIHREANRLGETPWMRLNTLEKWYGSSKPTAVPAAFTG